jgi:glycosyltransferase involved in cell wall biosynthesis
MTRIKVLYLIDSLQSGGAERSLAEMLPGMSRLGVDPLVVCFRHSEDGVEDRVRREFDLRFVAGNAPARVRAVRKLIRAERPDLLHTTLLASDLIGRVAAARTGVPVLTSLVNTSYDPIRFRDPHIRPWVFRRVQAVDSWTSRRLTAHFHAITHAVKDHNVEALRIPAERVTVIERGRDPERLGGRTAERRREARRMLDLSDDHEVVVNVGRQEYQKGHTDLLEAIERLAAARPNIVLLMVGRRGAASGDIDALGGRAAIAEHVRFLGYRDDAPDVLAAADLFAFPSLFEGLGGSLIEAMALGLPIVASDIPAIREVVEPGRNATLVPASAPDRLAEAIGQLLDDRSAAAAYASRSREIFEERFTLERSTERMVALYAEVLGRDRVATSRDA